MPLPALAVGQGKATYLPQHWVTGWCCAQKADEGQNRHEIISNFVSAYGVVND